MENSSSSEKGNIGGFLTTKPYNPPAWAAHLAIVPSHICSLAHLPTPIHKWNLPGLPINIEVYIKRDDLSGMQLSGNKARKLEFYMADAMSLGADCVVTYGAVQSNHCRATAVAAKYLNLDSFLILCSFKGEVDKDPGLTGNLLVGRLVGAHIELVKREEFKTAGGSALLNSVKERLVKEGRKPYVFPLGRTNAIGPWGYIEAVREIEQQIQNMEFGGAGFDDIVTACGRLTEFSRAFG